jgi:2-polyprenyl-3-methyl-5-hydroxy-6-metoxy-1,4-benzoquinol methylase
MQLAEFVIAHVPPSARVLEVGCGDGALTLALAEKGYDVTGIDPMAPPGEHFRRLLLEDLKPEDGPFDAVVASL